MTNEQRIVAYTEWVIKNRWLAIAITIMAVLASGFGMSKLSFTADYRVWFAEDNPQRVAFEDLQDTYTRNDNVLFVLQPADGDVFTPNTLEAVKRITEKSWQMPFSIRVDSITNYQHTWADGDDLTVEDLVLETEDLTQADLERIRQITLAEPMLIDRLISPDSKTTGINVTAQLPQLDPSESPQAMEFARKIAEEIRADYPDLKIALTGMIPLNNAFMEASMGDMATLTPLMYVVILLVCAFLLQSFSATLTTLLVIAFATLTGMGLGGWWGVALTPASAITPTIILTLAVADSIHVLVTMLRQMRQGMSKNEALIESMRINMHPVFLTSITTAIGFLSLNFSDAPPFHDLGNMSAAGVMAAFVYSVLFLPALMAILPIRVRAKKEGKGISLCDDVLCMDRFADFVIRNRKTLLPVMGVIVVVLASFIPRIELNDKFIEYFDHSVQFRNDSDFAAEHLSGSYQIEFSVESKEEGAVSDPGYLKAVDEFTIWLRSQSEVDHVLSITDTFKRLNKNMHADDPEWYRLPEERDLAAQYLLLYEFSLPYGLDLNNQIDVAKSATRITVTLKNISTVEMRAFNLRAEEWLKESGLRQLVTGEQGYQLTSKGGTSPTIMFAYISKRNINGMLTGTTLSLILISFILILALSSLKYGLLSLIPNLVPAAMAFGVWAILVGNIGMGVSIVIAMCLGIIVDDTVHFLSKYVRGRREKGLDSAESVRYAFSAAGTALVVTSIIIVAGFLILSLSPFKVNSHMGLLNSIIISIALIADFLLLPPLLIALRRRKKKGNTDEAPEPSTV